MKNTHFLRTALHLRRSKAKQLAPQLDAGSAGEALEALLYLRRATELMKSSDALGYMGKRIELNVRDLEAALGFKNTQ